MKETLGAYGRCDYVVACRLHSGVLSAILGIPFVLLSYSAKTDEFAEKVGCESVIAADAFRISRFSYLFHQIVENREVRIFALREKCGNIEKEARNSFETAFYGLERDKNPGTGA